MPFYRVNGLLMHVKLSGRKPPPAPCCARVPSPDGTGPDVRCLGISGFLCDWPLEGGGTCDAPLCPDHALQVAKDRHLCPIHAARQSEKSGHQPGLFE